ncbi:recombinase family protein [Clostridium sp. FP1]|uniref:recombinase family protein n=1 Tax=Clostridium sp. FP1 TaxID=2724076 RepID=UPI0013E93829|nr:recombinase family protein [Clostridium sp. FP1]MBZ9635628.1 recombinase family protein [Clostridium sp. FP1]
MKIAMYLRKSRADEELEKTLGQGETLSKHRRALLKFAKERKLNIVEIKEEIVSGESLFFRPKMLELLKEIEDKQYSGVLVMDIQRLGRGDMQEQGIILKTFKDSGTKIITPQKTYDLNNDFDEEYSEFEAFMSRKELKMINRRMQGGRVRSIEDGNYISPNPPLGYDIAFINKSRTLQPNPNESEVVRLIFKMYVDGSGAGTIAKYLNGLGYKSKLGNNFESSGILFTLKNLIYIGKVTWKKKDIRKSKDPNKIKDTRTRDISEWIISEGKHKAIIEEDVFDKAQEILKGKYHIPYKTANGAANPLAGLVICETCGSKMVMRKYGDKDPHIICNNNKCDNRSAKFKYIEHEIILALEQYLAVLGGESENITSTVDVDIYEKQIEMLSKELGTLSTQKLNLFDLLERHVYDDETFIERSNNLSQRSDAIANEIENIKVVIKKQSKKTNNDVQSKIKNVIDSYKISDDIALKNELLKSVLYKVEYKKSKSQRNDNFEINLFPRL